LTTAVKDDKTLWDAIAAGPRDFMKTHLLSSVQSASSKDLIHKMCDLLVEIAGAMYEDDETVWKPLLHLIFSLVNDADPKKIDGGLALLNGLFSYMIDEFADHKDEIIAIFRAKLSHPDLDIQLSTLQAVSSYIGMAQRKFIKPYRDLIPDMVKVVLNANMQDDEVVLKNALIEFNEIAEFEPKFFQPKFKEIFVALSPIVLKEDFADDLIRQQPLDWVVMIVERCPAVVQKDPDTLKAVFELVFKLMVDIDEDIEQEWTHPKEGFQEETPGEDGTQTDNLHFGKSCIDNLVSAVGDQICLPHLGVIVQTLMANETDWRYKNAALMAFSQIGEYVENIDLIAPMVGQVVEHLRHQNPKVRYAAVHCVG
jgi:importin-5